MRQGAKRFHLPPRARTSIGPAIPHPAAQNPREGKKITITGGGSTPQF